jgi:hypothetical protein
MIKKFLFTIYFLLVIIILTSMIVSCCCKESKVEEFKIIDRIQDKIGVCYSIVSFSYGGRFYVQTVSYDCSKFDANKIKENQEECKGECNKKEDNKIEFKESGKF